MNSASSEEQTGHNPGNGPSNALLVIFLISAMAAVIAGQAAALVGGDMSDALPWAAGTFMGAFALSLAAYKFSGPRS